MNINVLYGAGADRFIDMLLQGTGLKMPKKEALRVISAWKDTFPEIKKWHNRAGKSLTGLDKTISGRRYKAERYSDLLAISNQGSAGEVFRTTLLYLDKKDMIIDVGIHDSFIIEAPKDKAEEVAYELYKAMTAGWFKIMSSSILPDLAMPTDVSIGYNWGDIEAGKSFKVINYGGTYEEYLTFKDEFEG